jgi:hypothetical protein
MDFEEIHRRFNTEFTQRLLENKHIFYEIYEACGNTFDRPCGSYLFDGQTYRYCDVMYEKQELLYNSVKTAKDVLEIGTYMGHSLLIMLLSNPQLKITCIDISDRYALPAVNILNKYFNNAIRFIHSDSLSALQKMTHTFDFFHVDGYHYNDYITNEFILIKSLNNTVNNVLYIIFDDQENLTKLQEEIGIHYRILRKITPNCRWNNVYFEIQL